MNRILKVSGSSLRAASMIQLLVSIVIAAVIIGAAVVAFGRWNKQLSFDRSKSKILEVDRTLRAELKRDIQSAVVVTGLMQSMSGRDDAGRESDSSLAGLSAFYEAGENGPSATLQIFSEHYPTASGIATISTDGGTKLKLSWDVNAGFQSAIPSANYTMQSGGIQTTAYDPNSYYFFYGSVYNNRHEFYYLGSSALATSETTPYTTSAAQRSFVVSRATGSPSHETDFIVVPIALPNVRPEDVSTTGSDGVVPIFVGTALERDRYLYDGVGIVKQTYYSSGKNHSHPIAPRALDWKVYFEFSDTLTPGSRLVPPTNPQEVFGPRYKSPSFTNNGILIPEDVCLEYDAPPAGSGYRCAHWSDLRMVHIQYRILSDKPLNLNIEEIQSISLPTGFRWEPDGNLSYLSQVSIAPSRFAANVVEAGGVADECQPYSQNRCNPNCSEYFNQVATNPPFPANWEGYGDPQSPYCLCAHEGGDVYVDPDLNINAITGTPWTSRTGDQKNRLTSCLEYKGCSTWAWKASHPAYHIACSGLQPYGSFVSSSYPFELQNPFDGPGQAANAELRLADFISIWDGFKAAAETNPPDYTHSWYTLPSGEAPWSPLVPSSDAIDLSGTDQANNRARYLRCGGFNIPGMTNSLRVLLGIAESEWNSNIGGGPLTDPWQRKCGCFAYNVDVNGNKGNRIPKSFLDFRQICNINPTGGPAPFGATLADPLYCPNTWKPDGANSGYIGESVSDPYGLPGDLATFCECLKVHKPQHVDAGLEPGSYWPNVTYSQGWDFRLLRNASAPPTSGSAPSIENSIDTTTAYSAYTDGATSRVGSHQSLMLDALVTLFYIDGAEQAALAWPPAQTSCAEMHRFLENGYNNASRCLFTDGVSLPVDTVLSTYDATHSGYCHQHCLPSSSSTQARVVREIITGTAPGGALPATCHGPTSGGQFVQ